MSRTLPLDHYIVAIAGGYCIYKIFEDRDIKEDMLQVVETTKTYGKTFATLGLGVGFVGIFYMMYKETREQTRQFATLVDEIGQTARRYRYKN